MEAAMGRVIALTTLLVAGCATAPSGPMFAGLIPVTADTCAVYVYRLSKFAAGGHAPTLVVDGNTDASLKNGGYIRRQLTCGAHRLELLPMTPLHDFKPIH